MIRVLVVLRNRRIASIASSRRAAVIALICAVNVIGVITATGCYEDPDYRAIGFKCDGTHGCPIDQKCVGGACLSNVPAVAVVCGAVLCDASQKCCVTAMGSVTCIGITASCEGIAARCDGVEDCGGGACCASMLGSVECGQTTCTNQVCRENADCLDREKPLCCLGLELPNQPWGICGPNCPQPE